MTKIAVVGAGNVGATTAQRLLEMELGEVVLLDVVEGLPAGKALDLAEASALVGYDLKVAGGGDYGEAAGAQVVVITAGLGRRPGLSRDDLLAANAATMSQVVTDVVRVAPEAILIVVSNPLDAMCHVALKKSGFPRERVIGMAGVLDSARFRAFLAWELGVSVEDVQAMVLGGHGDTMLPLPGCATVSGIPITQLLSREKIDQLAERTRFGGGEVLGLLKFGGAYYAPAAATAQMVEAILRDKKRILPCSVHLEGEYGHSGIFLGVPVRLGRRGCEGIIEIALSDEERAALAASAEAVRGLVDKLEGLEL